MKNFESTYNRWLDGSLSETERIEFEATLDQETLRSAIAWPEVKALLQESARQIILPHPDFLNEQIRREITNGAAREHSPGASPFIRLICAGAACVGIAAALTLFVVPKLERSDAATIVVSAESSLPGTSAAAFQSPGDRGSVIWMDGMPFIPDGEQVQ